MRSQRRGLKFWLALLVLFALVAAACGDDDSDDSSAGGDTDTTAADDGGGQASGDGSIWVLLPDSASSDRWEKDDRRFFKEAFEAEGLSEGADFTIVNAEGDSANQISQAEQAIGEGASVIVLTSLDSGSGATIIDLAREADVAVVEYDRFNTEGDGGDVYVSFDNVAVGAAMAEVLEPAIDALDVETPRVVLLNGGPTDNNSTLFRSGYAAVAEARAEAGDWEIVADDFVPEWDNQAARDLMDQIIVAADNDVDAVFAANDGLADSTIAALDAAGIDPTTVPVSGQDATQAGMQNVALGTQTMSVYKPIKAEAYVAAAAALALRGGSDPAEISTPDFEFKVIGINADGSPADAAGGEGVVTYIALTPIPVTTDNMAETVIADGFRTVEEICTGDVAETDWCQENA